MGMCALVLSTLSLILHEVLVCDFDYRAYFKFYLKFFLLEIRKGTIYKLM